MKKIFGDINLTWKKLIIASIIVGVYAGLMALLPIAQDTSFTDLNATFEVWILFGILIIMNSRSAKDSALKCFVFFLISQPLIYFVQDIINHSNLFNTYYRYWFMWTLACLPMGYIGYYIKKDKWWGLIILAPILALVGYQLLYYIPQFMYSFPRHILTVLFCIITLIIYPLAIFENKKIKITGTVISILIVIVVITLSLLKPLIYSTDILSDSKYKFDDTYKVYFEDSSYGKLSIKYEEGIEAYFVHAEFKKAGKTKFTLESPTGEKIVFKITNKRTTYDVKEIK